MDLSIIMVNPTDVPFKYALYLTLPKSRLCASVVWKTGDLPGKDSPTLAWPDGPEIVLGKVGDQTIETGTAWPAQAGKRYTLVYDMKTQQIEAEENPDSGSRIPEELVVENRTGMELTVGLGLDGVGALYMESILSNENVLFDMLPLYHFCLFDPAAEIEAGQVVPDPYCRETPLPMEGALAAAELTLDKERIVAMVTLSVDAEGAPTIAVSYLGAP